LGLLLGSLLENHIKETGITIYNTGQEYIETNRMKLGTKDSGRMGACTVLVNFSGRMVLDTKGNGNITHSMVEVHTLEQLELCTKVIGYLESTMVREKLFIRIKITTWEILWMESTTARVFFINMRVVKVTVEGLKLD
jgi:hypothetical protein